MTAPASGTRSKRTTKKRTSTRKHGPWPEPMTDPELKEGELIPGSKNFLPQLLFIPEGCAPRKIRRDGRMAPFEPTDYHRGVVTMAKACGMSDQTIASCIVNPETGESISLDTLRIHFADELAGQGKKIEFNLMARLYYSALYLGDTRANIFLLKSRFGWRDEDAKLVPPLQGEVGKDANRAALVVPGVNSVEEWERIAEQHRQFIEEQRKRLLAPPQPQPEAA